MFQAGKWNQAEPSPDLEERFNKLLQEKSGKMLTLYDLKKMGLGQVFEYGYVWERSPETREQQINRRLFLKDGEIEKAVDLLSQLQENPSRTDRQPLRLDNVGAQPVRQAIRR